MSAQGPGPFFNYLGRRSNIKGPGLLVSDKKIFEGFLYMCQCLGQGHFWLQGNNLNNLGRGPLGEAMYQISKAWAFCFQTRRFFPYMALCKTSDP